MNSDTQDGWELRNCLRIFLSICQIVTIVWSHINLIIFSSWFTTLDPNVQLAMISRYWNTGMGGLHFNNIAPRIVAILLNICHGQNCCRQCWKIHYIVWKYSLGWNYRNWDDFLNAIIFILWAWIVLHNYNLIYCQLIRPSN